MAQLSPFKDIPKNYVPEPEAHRRASPPLVKGWIIDEQKFRELLTKRGISVTPPDNTNEIELKSQGAPPWEISAAHNGMSIKECKQLVDLVLKENFKELAPIVFVLPVIGPTEGEIWWNRRLALRVHDAATTADPYFKTLQEAFGFEGEPMWMFKHTGFEFYVE